MSDQTRELYEPIGRPIADPGFRAALIEDARKAPTEASYTFREAEIHGLLGKADADTQAAVEGPNERFASGANPSPGAPSRVQ